MNSSSSSAWVPKTKGFLLRQVQPVHSRVPLPQVSLWLLCRFFCFLFCLCFQTLPGQGRVLVARHLVAPGTWMCVVVASVVVIGSSGSPQPFSYPVMKAECQLRNQKGRAVKAHSLFYGIFSFQRTEGQPHKAPVTSAVPLECQSLHRLWVQLLSPQVFCLRP